jgi:hypothetical protein
VTTTKPSKRFIEAANAVIDAGNQMTDECTSGADVCIAAGGMIAGAVEFWLRANHPCGREWCEDCKNFNTPEKRLSKLTHMVQEYARSSQTFHAEHDVKEPLQ